MCTGLKGIPTVGHKQLSPDTSTAGIIYKCRHTIRSTVQNSWTRTLFLAMQAFYFINIGNTSLQQSKYASEKTCYAVIAMGIALLASSFVLLHKSTPLHFLEPFPLQVALFFSFSYCILFTASIHIFHIPSSSNPKL